VDAIADAISSVDGVRILDQHSDMDHNRTVITFVGSPPAVEEAAFKGIARAAELIDLEQHTGEHPRIGATDVVPFIPISGATIEDCVQMARRLGQRVGDELSIPIYLYEAAATRHDRRNLENVRRGQYEALKVELGSNADREPDFGPNQVGPAGATVIGARPFLIAYNVYLTTDDVTVADKIARKVRHSSGGLRFVKALGLLVEGRAQVSMNLTDFRKTPVARVVEMIRREAVRHGAAIDHSELVGLIPQEALVDAAVWYLQLDQFEPHQVLETRLFTAVEEPAQLPDQDESSAATIPVDSNFLIALASASPTPGGGSASAYAAAMAAALVVMVARLTINKKKYAHVEEEMRTIEQHAEAMRVELTSAVSDDSAAFNAVMNAYRLPKNTPQEKEERTQRIQSTTLLAAQVPMQVAKTAVEILKYAQILVLQANLNAISDAGSAAALAGAAISGAALNVRINALGLKDKRDSAALIEEISKLEVQAKEMQDQILSQIYQRGGLNPE
jgi:glutamate formiminotransferase/formiminotetrahydrofolate cyclodeaminase